MITTVTITPKTLRRNAIAKRLYSEGDRRRETIAALLDEYPTVYETPSRVVMSGTRGTVSITVR